MTYNILDRADDIGKIAISVGMGIFLAGYGVAAVTSAYNTKTVVMEYDLNGDYADVEEVRIKGVLGYLSAGITSGDEKISQNTLNQVLINLSKPTEIKLTIEKTE